MKKAAILIDGGNTRALARSAGRNYDPDYILRLAHACIGEGEELFRALYYDCAPFSGTLKLPVSGTEKVFAQSGKWLKDLAQRDGVAVRLGTLKFRGFVPRKTPIGRENPTDDDFKPKFEQKGVDMRIGLDMAVFADTRAVDRIILCTQDTDCIPAMKLVRRAGLQVGLVRLPNSHIAPELLEHSDFTRHVAWP